jgi:hypothetical protein
LDNLFAGNSDIASFAIYILGLAKKNPNCHFFMDEVPFGSPGVDSDFFNQLEKLINQNNFVWIACQKTMTPNKEQNSLNSKFAFLLWYPRRKPIFFNNYRSVKANYSKNCANFLATGHNYSTSCSDLPEL